MVQPVKFGQIHISPDERIYFTDKRKNQICKLIFCQELWSGMKADNHQGQSGKAILASLFFKHITSPAGRNSVSMDDFYIV